MGVGRRKWKKRREEEEEVDEVEKQKERGYLLIFVDGFAQLVQRY